MLESRVATAASFDHDQLKHYRLSIDQEYEYQALSENASGAIVVQASRLHNASIHAGRAAETAALRWFSDKAWYRRAESEYERGTRVTPVTNLSYVQDLACFRPSGAGLAGHLGAWHVVFGG